jgi:hypothetical protein
MKIIIEQEKDNEGPLRRKVLVILEVYAEELQKKGQTVTFEDRWKAQ